MGQLSKMIRKTFILVIFLIFNCGMCVAENTESKYFNQGISELEKKNHEEAILLFNKALLENLESPKIHCFLGISNYNLKNYNKSLKYFLKAVELKNDYKEALFLAGKTYYRLNNKEKAIYYIEQSIKYGTNYSTEYFLLAKVYFENNDFKKAEINLNQYLKIDQNNKHASMLLNKIKEIQLVKTNTISEPDFIKRQTLPLNKKQNISKKNNRVVKNDSEEKSLKQKLIDTKNYYKTNFLENLSAKNTRQKQYNFYGRYLCFSISIIIVISIIYTINYKYHKDYKFCRGTHHLKQIKRSIKSFYKQIREINLKIKSANKSIQSSNVTRELKLKHALRHHLLEKELDSISGIGQVLKDRIISNFQFYHSNDDLCRIFNVIGIGEIKKNNLIWWAREKEAILDKLLNEKFPSKQDINEYHDSKIKIHKEEIIYYKERLNEINNLMHIMIEQKKQLSKVSIRNLKKAVKGKKKHIEIVNKYILGVFPEWGEIPDWYKKMLELN